MADIYVSGVVIGEVSPAYKLNYSRKKTINPILEAQNLSYEDGDCPLAVIEYDGFNPNKMINTVSFENEVHENTEGFAAIEELSGIGTTFPVKRYPFNVASSGEIDYLVTDKVSDNGNGVPLFYQYELQFDAVGDTDGTIIQVVYKNIEIIVDPKTYQIQYSHALLNDGSGRYEAATWNDTIIQGRDTHRARILFPLDTNESEDFYVVKYNRSVYGAVEFQEELVELEHLYGSGDFDVGSSGVFLKDSSLIPSETLRLYIVKNPDFRIYPMGVSIMKGSDGFNQFMSDQLSSWNQRINVGSFVVGSGIYNDITDNLYSLKHFNSPDKVALTNIRSELINNNILKTEEAPIWISGYVHPDYTIDIYDKTQSGVSEPAGTIGIDINGISRTDIKISSIDRKKGFLMLSKDIDPLDDVELSFYSENDGYAILENLELNPKVITGTPAHHISGYLNGLGIALMPYDSIDSDTGYPYIYDPNVDEATRTATTIPPPGVLGTTTVNWADNEFITIAEIDLNKLSVDSVKMTDARRPGGGFAENRKLLNWFDSTFGSGIGLHEHEWYVGKGYYGGAPLPVNNNIVIHIPENLLSGVQLEWEEYYAGLVTDQEETLDPGTRDQARIKGREEYKVYMDKAIKRYISAGSVYTLVPTESGEFKPILSLE